MITSFMKKHFFSFILISIFLLNSGCKKNATEPISEDLQPGRRDYVWTVDTLNYPYNTIVKIWGSSPTDVWAVSPGGDLDKTIFHFDGMPGPLTKFTGHFRLMLFLDLRQMMFGQEEGVDKFGDSMEAIGKNSAN